MNTSGYSSRSQVKWHAFWCLLKARLLATVPTIALHRTSDNGSTTEAFISLWKGSKIGIERTKNMVWHFLRIFSRTIYIFKLEANHCKICLLLPLAQCALLFGKDLVAGVPNGLTFIYTMVCFLLRRNRWLY